MIRFFENATTECVQKDASCIGSCEQLITTYKFDQHLEHQIEPRISSILHGGREIARISAYCVFIHLSNNTIEQVITCVCAVDA